MGWGWDWRKGRFRGNTRASSFKAFISYITGKLHRRKTSLCHSYLDLSHPYNDIALIMTLLAQQPSPYAAAPPPKLAPNPSTPTKTHFLGTGHTKLASSRG